jgi:hypothetical protein
MERDRTTPEPEESETVETVSDEYDDAVIAADDTGMLASERRITAAELAEAQEDEAGAGDV